MIDEAPILIDLRRQFADVPITPDALALQARHVKTTGAGPGSLEDEGLDYFVLDAAAIMEHQPELILAYQALTPLISDVLGCEVRTSADLGAININLLKGWGGRYERHVDNQPWTLILSATDYGRDHLGGELVVQHPILGELRIPPMRGQGVLFDGSRLPHRVEPLRGAERLTPLRITVPMVFVAADVPEVRAPGADSYLYGGR